MSFNTIVKSIVFIALISGALASAAGAETLSASSSATAELNESAVETLDQSRIAGTIVVPKIRIDCTGKCSDKLMKSAAIKVAEIQQLAVACKRDVASYGEMQHKVRQLVDSLPLNVKLSVAKAGNTSVRRRSNRQNIGFCDLELARTPTITLASN